MTKKGFYDRLVGDIDAVIDLAYEIKSPEDISNKKVFRGTFLSEIL